MSEKPKSGGLAIRYGEPRHVLFFDAFSVERSGDFVTMMFGNQTTQQCFCAVISKKVLDSYRESFLVYLHKIGLPDNSFKVSPPRGNPTASFPVDHVGLAQVDDMAEISFHAFSLKKFADSAAKDPQKVIDDAAFFIGMFRCSMETQRHWIRSIYPS